MDDLQLIGVHENGEFLVLGGPDGQARFRLALDDALRAAVRWERSQAGARSSEAEPLRPRDVQAMIRAGANAVEVAERAGWAVEKVRRYEGPILAERAHVAQLAGTAVLRTRTVGFGAPTLAERVAERLTQRDVAAEDVSWDSWRSEDGQWTVEARFSAGGRLRTASWHFSRPTMTVSAQDDEARWLSEEDHHGDSPAVRHVVTSGRAKVYDVEAEGGLRPGAAQPGSSGPTADDAAAAPHQASADQDLVTSVRERSGARSRRRGTRRASVSPSSLPAGTADVDHALPLDQVDYDPQTMPPPPAAHADPDPEGVDGRPEPEVEQAAAGPGAPAEAAPPSPDEPAEVGSAAASTRAGVTAETDSDHTAAAATDTAAGTGADQAVSADTDIAADTDPVGSGATDTAADTEPVGSDTNSTATEPAADTEAPSPPARADQAAPSTGTPAAGATPAATRRAGQRAQPAGRQRGRARARKPRTEVPAWDDIVFGGGAPPE